MVDRNKILEFMSGSKLYGTDIETSDTDFLGIFIAPKEFYLGLSTVNEVDLSITSKTEDGKNDINAIDRKFNEFRKFVKLAADGNPNAIEQLFVPNEKIIYKNSFGDKLLANAHLFPSKLVKQRFIGYAISQIHKAKVKPDNYSDLLLFKELYEKLPVYLHGVQLNESKSLSIGKLITFHEDFATIGVLNFNLKVKLSSVFNSVSNRIGNASHRQDLWTKFGMDLKFGMHAVRLTLEGKELLETGRIEFPLKQKDLLLDIRNGKLSLDEINELMLDTKNELDNYEGNLRSTPNYDSINKFLIETVEEFFDIITAMCLTRPRLLRSASEHWLYARRIR